jgi:hypothetical protein
MQKKTRSSIPARGKTERWFGVVGNAYPAITVSPPTKKSNAKTFGP